MTFVTVEVSCPDGYTAAEDRSDCIDINECTTNNGGCLQQCVNIPGSFYCKCFDGFYESNITCIDIDECATATHRCSYSCLDGLHPPGSYTCGCTSGFYANGTVCENINECALGTDLCSQICIDNEGSYSCDCHYGFRIDPRNRFGCIDIDECLQQNNCSQTCHNQIGTYNCSCFSGYTLAEDLNTCIDINECASATTNDCQYPVYCANSPGGFSCGCPIGYNSTDRVHCAPLPCLFEWNQWSSECFLCKGQIRNRNRTTDPDLNNGSPLCFGILYHEVQECQFPCVIKAQKDGASTTAALVQEWWSRGQWLADPTYFPDMTAHNVEQQGNNIMMMLSSPSSFQCSQDDPLVSNFTDTLIQNAQNITPGIDPSRFSVSLVPTNGQCGLQFSVSNLADYTLYYGIGGGIAAFLLIAILITIFFLLWKRKLKLRQINYLPKPLRASFFYAFSGSRDGDYYQKEVFVGSPERKFIQSMLEEKLDLLPLQITNIHAVYSPQLLASFVNYWNNMESRIADNAKLWRSEAWKNIVDTNGLKKWVMSEYDKIIDTFSWNQGRLEPLIPAIHGTDLAIAQKICCNGFGALSTLDDGFYGKGIYFTTSCLYAVPYFATRAKPALILAYVLPGYPYPTTENRTGDHSLMGSAIMKGHQSHFVIVKRDGDPVPNIPSEDNSYYTELVVAQEAQVVPAYIIEIDRGNLPELMKKYQRAISDLIAENQSRQKKRNHSHEPDPDYHKSDDL
uniref:EGF-like domain-containing protein n=1 Tax=Arcella intermedia TaxID=1963864 RepID=A0A6B2KYL5_9EUKA